MGMPKDLVVSVFLVHEQQVLLVKHKKLELFPTGHSIPPEDLRSGTRDWFDRYLDPVSLNPKP